jgi:hypothetical protein
MKCTLVVIASACTSTFSGTKGEPGGETEGEADGELEEEGRDAATAFGAAPVIEGEAVEVAGAAALAAERSREWAPSQPESAKIDPAPIPVSQNAPQFRRFRAIWPITVMLYHPCVPEGSRSHD